MRFVNWLAFTCFGMNVRGRMKLRKVAYISKHATPVHIYNTKTRLKIRGVLPSLALAKRSDTLIFDQCVMVFASFQAYFIKFMYLIS